MIVEALWRNLKRVTLHQNNRPRLDFVVHLILTSSIPASRMKFAEAHKQLHSSRPQTLTSEQRSFKRSWTKLCSKVIKGSYETDINQWTCTCGAQKYNAHLLCKHLVQQAPHPPNTWWPKAFRCHTTPFIELSAVKPKRHPYKSISCSIGGTHQASTAPTTSATATATPPSQPTTTPTPISYPHYCITPNPHAYTYTYGQVPYGTTAGIYQAAPSTSSSTTGSGSKYEGCEALELIWAQPGRVRLQVVGRVVGRERERLGKGGVSSPHLHLQLLPQLQPQHPRQSRSLNLNLKRRHTCPITDDTIMLLYLHPHLLQRRPQQPKLHHQYPPLHPPPHPPPHPRHPNPNLNLPHPHPRHPTLPQQHPPTHTHTLILTAPSPAPNHTHMQHITHDKAKLTRSYRLRR
ncbi:hypothetical protein M422DRAFT_268975 [Sphaerobolus stellatus SS14]|uniref:SWIM-type domain-containing protein n=1 Tax=Sphaerobolus stellatus (strain SS14) TaxID=990650 RepID=A0A0C9UWB8_SPHS4|nr:hypothetical protein M422DRAFT_268975 [Sphaerobolus stellatus SS14]